MWCDSTDVDWQGVTAADTRCLYDSTISAGRGLHRLLLLSVNGHSGVPLRGALLYILYEANPSFLHLSVVTCIAMASVVGDIEVLALQPRVHNHATVVPTRTTKQQRKYWKRNEHCSGKQRSAVFDDIKHTTLSERAALAEVGTGQLRLG